MESPVPKLGSGRPPETKRRAGHTGDPTMAGRPGRRSLPEAVPGTALGPRDGVVGDGVEAGSLGLSPVPRRPRPSRRPRPGPPRDSLPPGPRPVYSPPGDPGAGPSGRASPARPRLEVPGHAAPRAAPRPARPRRQRRGGCCPSSELGGRSCHGTPVCKIPNPACRNRRGPRQGSPPCPDLPADGIPNIAKRGPRGRGRRCAAVLRGSSSLRLYSLSLPAKP